MAGQAVLCHIELARGVRASGLARERFLSPIVGLTDPGEPADAPEVIAVAVDPRGRRHALAVRVEGGVRLNFDLPATLETIRGETYTGARLGNSVVTRAPFDYTMLPMWMIGLASRLLNRPVDLKALPPYPQYPLDHSADLLYALGRGDLAVRPLLWPEGKRYALVLTHDIDTGWIFRHTRWLEACCAIEEGLGMRSAWYVVPTAMTTPVCRRGLALLSARGHEIGVHGLKHDPTLAEQPFEVLVEQFRKARAMITEFAVEGAVGYRAPWLSRSETMHRALRTAGYLYDSSPPTADFQRNSPECNNGCGTLFPFLRAGLLVLPITVPQDSMAARLSKNPEAFWDWVFDLVQRVKVWGGIAVISSHLQPHHSANLAMQEGYGRLLERLAGDAEVWMTLPREAARWARRQLEA